MASSCSILILFFVAAHGYSDSNKITLHTEKPEIYERFQAEIDYQISKNWAILSRTHNPELEDSETIEGNSENCEYISKLETYYMIESNGTTNYIVQSSVFTQRIRVSLCRSRSPCFTYVISQKSSFAKKVEAYCEQKYGEVSLYVYDPVNKEILYKRQQIPICCNCQLRSLE